MDSDLSTLLALTYLGGSSNEVSEEISLCIDNGGNIFVSSITESSDFPTITGSYDVSKSGGSDLFISKLSNNLDMLLASTYLGGTSSEVYPQITIDDNNNVFVTAITGDPNFPTTIGAYDRSYNGSADLFVSKFDNNLTTLQASTFLGGQYEEYWPRIAIDANGSVFISLSPSDALK